MKEKPTDSPSYYLSSEQVGSFAGRPFIRPQIALIEPGKPFAGKDEDKAARLFDELLAMTLHSGKQPFGWQQWVVSEMLRERDDAWASRHFALCVPRQNGKGDVIESRELIGILAAGERKVLHTAHNLETAEDAWSRMLERIENNPHLSKLRLRVERSNGRKAIHFEDFGSIYYRTRSRFVGRGFQFDLIVNDEAMYITEGQISSLLPTQATRPRAQMVYAFTGLFPDSEHMHAVRKTMVEAGQPVNGFSWLEWSIPTDADPSLDEWAVRCNPSMLDGLISLDTVRSERTGIGNMDAYARERLNLHHYPADAVSVMTSDVLDEIEDHTANHGPRVVLGIHIAKNLSRSWIAAASILPDGRQLIELIESRPDTYWVVDRIREIIDNNRITDPVYLSTITASGIMAKRFDKHRIPYKSLNAADWVKACNNVLEAYQDRTLVHLGQPELTTSLIGARLDDRGQGRIWSWEHSQHELGPTVAATHALAGAIDVDSAPTVSVALPSRHVPRRTRMTTQRTEGIGVW